MSLRNDSPKEIRRIVRLAWSHYVLEQTQHRKGITFQPIDLYTQHKINRQFSDASRKLLVLNLTGGYQTGAVKSLWGSSQSINCAYCEMPDIHQHRQLECPNFQHLRDKHPEAITYLHEFPNLLWFPLATQHAAQKTYNLLVQDRIGPILDVPNIADCPHFVFFFIQMALVINRHSKTVVELHGRSFNMSIEILTTLPLMIFKWRRRHTSRANKQLIEAN